MGREQSHLPDAQGNWVWYDLIHFMISLPRRRKYFPYTKWDTVFENEQCCCCSAAQLCLTLCDTTDCSTPGFPIHHHPSEFAQTQVHWIGDAIQLSCTLSSTSPALNLSQHQCLPASQLFASGGQSIGASVSASVLPMNIQGRFPLGLTGLISLLSKGLSRVFSSTTVWNSLAVSLLYDTILTHVVVVQSLSHSLRLPWTAARQASLSFPVSGVCLNSRSLSWWCHLIISSSVIPFSSCPQSFPALRSFPTSQLFTSGGQSIGTSASESVLLMNIQGWFPLGSTSLISLLPKGFSRVFLNTTVQKHQFFGTQPYSWSNSHTHIWLLKNHSFDNTDLCQQSNVSVL